MMSFILSSVMNMIHQQLDFSLKRGQNVHSDSSKIFEDPMEKKIAKKA
jgi:hypothetical protein